MHICIYIEHTRHSLIQSQGSSKRTKSRDPCMYIQQIFSNIYQFVDNCNGPCIYIYAHIMCTYIYMFFMCNWIPRRSQDCLELCQRCVCTSLFGCLDTRIVSLLISAMLARKFSPGSDWNEEGVLGSKRQYVRVLCVSLHTHKKHINI